MDKEGKIIGEKSFESGRLISSTPSLVPHKSNTWLSYPDGENVRILSLSLSSILAINWPNFFLNLNSKSNQTDIVGFESMRYMGSVNLINFYLEEFKFS